MEKGSIKHLIVLIIAITLFGMILYPLFDIIYCKFITNNEFVYSVNGYLIKPLLFGIILGIVFWIIDRKANNHDKKI